jgi:hypothetical protein
MHKSYLSMVKKQARRKKLYQILSTVIFFIQKTYNETNTSLTRRPTSWKKNEKKEQPTPHQLFWFEICSYIELREMAEFKKGI